MGNKVVCDNDMEMGSHFWLLPIFVDGSKMGACCKNKVKFGKLKAGDVKEDGEVGSDT